MSQYSKAVDAHIYAFQTSPDRVGCKTQADWIALAIAALDQAGLEVKDQQEIEKIINQRAPNDWP